MIERHEQHEESRSNKFTDHSDKVILDRKHIRTLCGIFQVVREATSCSFAGVYMLVFVNSWLSSDVKGFH